MTGKNEVLLQMCGAVTLTLCYERRSADILLSDNARCSIGLCLFYQRVISFRCFYTLTLSVILFRCQLVNRNSNLQ